MRLELTSGFAHHLLSKGDTSEVSGGELGMKAIVNSLKVSLPLCSLAPVTPAFAAEKPHATIIVGTHHYSPQYTMPILAKELERLGFEVALINPEKNAEKKKEAFSGLEVLKKTDVAVFFVRWLSLEGPQFEQIMNYVKAGKPVVCLRTSTHAFFYPEGHEKRELTFSFGKDVFGTPYRVHLAGASDIKVAEGAQTNPLLTGVSGNWKSPGTLYITKLEPGVTPLAIGTGQPKGGKAVTRNNMYGTHELTAPMSDTMAWTWKNKWGGKAFSTSFGHVGDFDVPQSMRIIVNGIHWAAGAKIPSADTEVRTFKVPAELLKKKKGKK